MLKNALVFAAGALAVARGTQMELSGWVARFRARKEAEAKDKKYKK